MIAGFAYYDCPTCGTWIGLPNDAEVWAFCIGELGKRHRPRNFKRREVGAA